MNSFLETFFKDSFSEKSWIDVEFGESQTINVINDDIRQIYHFDWGIQEDGKIWMTTDLWFMLGSACNKYGWEIDHQRASKLELEDKIKLFKGTGIDPKTVYAHRLSLLYSLLEHLISLRDKWIQESVLANDKTREYMETVIDQDISPAIKSLRYIIDNVALERDIIIGRKRIKKHNDIPIETIKSVPIMTILGNPVYVRAGPKRLWIKSPWRSERTASLLVYENNNSWYDFGEHIGGSNIDLVMKLYSCGIKEACTIIQRYI